MTNLIVAFRNFTKAPKLLLTAINGVSLDNLLSKRNISTILTTKLKETQRTNKWDICTNYSRTPIIRTLVIRISNNPDRLGPSGKHFLTVIVLHPFTP